MALQSRLVCLIESTNMDNPKLMHGQHQYSWWCTKWPKHPSITDMDVQHKLQVNIEVFWKYAVFIGIGNKICWFMVMYNVIASLLEVTIA
jgi:hypothetical protein